MNKTNEYKIKLACRILLTEHVHMTARKICAILNKARIVQHGLSTSELSNLLRRARGSNNRLLFECIKNVGEVPRWKLI